MFCSVLSKWCYVKCWCLNSSWEDHHRRGAGRDAGERQSFHLHLWCEYSCVCCVLPLSQSAALRCVSVLRSSQTPRSPGRPWMRSSPATRTSWSWSPASGSCMRCSWTWPCSWRLRWASHAHTLAGGFLTLFAMCRAVGCVQIWGDSRLWLEYMEVNHRGFWFFCGQIDHLNVLMLSVTHHRPAFQPVCLIFSSVWLIAVCWNIFVHVLVRSAV